MAVVLGLGRAAQKILRLGIDLVALEAQVAGYRGGHVQRRVVRVDRARGLREQVTRNDVGVWIERQLADLEAVTAR